MSKFEIGDIYVITENDVNYTGLFIGDVIEVISVDRSGEGYFIYDGLGLFLSPSNIGRGIVKLNIAEEKEEVKPTTKLQLASLDAFANGMGYQYNGKYYEDEEGTNKVGFKRMRDLHNGNLFGGSWKTVANKHLTTVVVGSKDIPLAIIDEAWDNKLVETVKLQQKKNGFIVTQNHMIRLAR